MTLLVLVLLVVVVTGFLSTTRVEQMAARNYTYQSAAEQMAQLATKQAIGVLRSNYQTAMAGVAFATQPGAITVLQSGNSITLPLYSSGGSTTNLNALATNGLITGSAAQAVNAGLVEATDGTGARLGRYAFFIDDESSKLPLNASVDSRATLNPLSPRPYGVAGVAGFGPVSASAFASVVGGSRLNNNSTMSNWSYFFTPEQAVRLFSLVRTNLPLLTSAYETNTAYSTNTPWGSPKVYLNSLPMSDVGVQQIVTALTNAKLTTLFGQHFGDKYGAANLPQLAANILEMRNINVFTINPAIFWRTNALLGASGLSLSIMASPTSANLKKTNGIPPIYLGHTPFPMLTDVSVTYVYGWAAPGLMTVRFIVECTLFNPFDIAFNVPTSGIYAQIDKAIFPVYYQNNPGEPIENRYRGPFGTQPDQTALPYNDAVDANDPWGDGGGIYSSLTPANGVSVVPLGSVPARSSVVRFLTFDVTFDESNPTAQADSSFASYVILDQIKILADTNNPASIRDWCSGFDLFNSLASSAAGPAQFAIQKPLGVAGNPEGDVTLGGAPLIAALAPPPTGKISKMDPRMRPSLAVAAPPQSAAPGRAWQAVAYASSSLPSAFTNASIPADLSFSTSPVDALFDTNLPPYLNVTAADIPTYFSSADLGKVFTGMPWRRLRLQPQPLQESNSAGRMIPDWVILDVFDCSTPTKPVTPVNPNSTLVHNGSAVTRAAAGLLSQIGVLTNSARMTQLGNPALISDAPVTQKTYASLVTATPAKISAISSNAASVGSAASWTTNSAWRTQRSARGFPTNALLLPSEVTEISGIADYVAPTNNASKVNEQRLGALFPGLQTKSRFFMIYALGEAYEGTNTSAPVVGQRILKTAVRVNTNSSPPSIDILYQTASQD